MKIINKLTGKRQFVLNPIVINELFHKMQIVADEDGGLRESYGLTKGWQPEDDIKRIHEKIVEIPFNRLELIICELENAIEILIDQIGWMSENKDFEGKDLRPSIKNAKKEKRMIVTFINKLKKIEING